ncbi:MAG: acyltransferase [Paracoccaceae bacterium]
MSEVGSSEVVSPGTYGSIQMLRAAAALSVLVFHLGDPLKRLGHDGGWPSAFSAGVDVFFVISGFIMWTTTRQKPVSAADFLKRRLIRVVPMYWIVTSLVIAILIFGTNRVSTGALDWRHAISSYAFVAMEHPGRPGEIAPLLLVGWTLNYEMAFYGLFALSLCLKARARLWGLLLTLAGLALLGAASDGFGGAPGFYTAPIVLEFALGIMIAVRVAAGRWLSGKAAWTSVALGLLLLALSPSEISRTGGDRLIAYGLPAGLIVMGALSLERGGLAFTARLPLLIGQASYTIYLVHGVALSAGVSVWLRLGLPSDGPAWRLAFALSVASAAALAGLLSWRFVERPTDRLVRHGLARRARREVMP